MENAYLFDSEFVSKIKVVEISVWDKFIMEIVESRRRFGVELIHRDKNGIMDYHHKANKRLTRKTFKAAHDIAMKWKEEFESKGYEVQPSMGTSLNN